MTSSLIAGSVPIRHERPALPALTSIRFFAAVYVVLFHYNLQDRLTAVPVLSYFMTHGYAGVTLFFALSGYILAYNYPTVKDTRSFLINRFARIYPVYLLSLALMMLHQATRPDLWRQNGLFVGGPLAVVMLQAWWERYAFVLNSPAWTLSVEAFFYVTFPFFIRWLARIDRKLFFLLQALYAVFVCIPLALSAFPSTRALAGALATHIEGTIPLFRYNTFLVGAYLGLHYGRTMSTTKQPAEKAHASDAFERESLLLGTLASIVLLSLPTSEIVRPIHTLLLTYSFSLLIRGLSGLRKGLFCRDLMQLGGEISYSIYILQVPISLTVLHLRHNHYWTIANMAIALTCILICSYLSFRFVETPARLLIRKAFRMGHRVNPQSYEVAVK